MFATINGTGTLIGTTITGPFGEQVSGQTVPGNTLGGATYNWVGSNEKLTESDMALQPTQMGARVYLASIGRFLQVDPQEGGTDNAYAYANDPVNDFDLDGTSINWRQVGKWAVVGASIAGAIACGVSVVCGVAVGAAAGAAAYAVAKGGTKEFSARGLAGATVVGGALGAVSGLGQATIKGFKIAQAAKGGVGNYSLGSANRTTSFFAGKFFTTAGKGLRTYRSPFAKVSGPHAGKLVSNFERFLLRPTSSRAKRYPNRVGNGHLIIKGWW